MIPVTVKTMEMGGTTEPRGLPEEVLEQNKDFRRFVARMRGMERIFILSSKSDSNPRIVAPPTDDEAGAQPKRSCEWLDCCLREYLVRKRAFSSRYESRTLLLLRITAPLAVFLLMLWVIWPIWRVLIDVETDVYYKVLEVPSSASSSDITKAYRAMVKRWHPDHNPQCGNYCREKTERAKEAYDMLLSRGEHRHTLVNQYHEGLMALRSLLSFRAFQISSDAAMHIFLTLMRLCPCFARKSFTVRLICIALVLTSCAINENFFLSGFSIVTVVQLYYCCLSMSKASAQQHSVEEVRNNSYCDLVREAALLLGLAFAAGVLRWCRGTTAVSLEEIFRLLYGSFYILSFLYRFSPNLYDNFLMRKCSLPLTYVDVLSGQFRWKQFVASEFIFILDDLFVFTCRIPSSCRVLVYVVHFISLCQLFTLPWDAPITKRRFARDGAHAPPIASVATSATESKTKFASRGVDEAEKISDKLPFTESYLTQAEEAIVADLDGEAVSWLDPAVLKYKDILISQRSRYTRQHGQRADIVDITFSDDLQSVLVVAAGRVAGNDGGTSQPRVEILSLVRDPEMSHLLAVERGPRMMVPARPNPSWNLNHAREIYRRLLGKNAALTSTRLWRARTQRCVSTAVWKDVIAAAFICSSAACVCLFFSVSQYDVARGSKGVDDSLRPQLFARYMDVLPPDHFVNAKAAGFVSVGRFPLCVLDWWDAVATLGVLQ